MSFYGMEKKHRAINTLVNSARQKNKMEKRSGTFLNKKNFYPTVLNVSPFR